MIYDVAVLGAGPAGLSSCIYGARGGLSVINFEKGLAGGQIANTAFLENYPGGVMGESGIDFSMRLFSQADSFGFEKVKGEVEKVELKGKTKKIISRGKEYSAKTIIIALGVSAKKLGVPGEDEFIGRGVSYCATCDGPLFRGLDIFVIGGGDSALSESIFLSKFAKKIYIVHRRDKFRAAKSLIEKAEKLPNIEFLMDRTVNEIMGTKFIEKIELKSVKSGKIETFHPAEGTDRLGVFIFAGLTPNTELFKDELKLHDGYIKTDEKMQTEIEGVFAAGDIRVKDFRQVITACSDGAIAANSCEKYLM